MASVFLLMLLQTPALIITNFTTGDAPFIVELLNTEGWITQIGDRGVRTISDAENYLLKGPMASYEKNGFGLMKVSLKDNTPIGMCGLIKRDSLESVDIGFALLPQYEGRGYAYEASSAIIKLAKTLDITRVVAITLPTNQRSIKLLERLGLRYEKPIKIPNDDEELILMGIDL